jgi:hypothetical protein
LEEAVRIEKHGGKDTEAGNRNVIGIRHIGIENGGTRALEEDKSEVYDVNDVNNEAADCETAWRRRRGR